MEAITVFITAMLPVSELRGAIPLGMSMGLPLKVIIPLAIAGNMMPVIPLLLFLTPVSNYLRSFKFWDRFFNWLFKRTEKRGFLIERFEAIGLALFVAIPLPITGAWTGCAAATFFKIRFRYAFPAILAGVILSSIIVTTICLTGANVTNGS